MSTLRFVLLTTFFFRSYALLLNITVPDQTFATSLYVQGTSSRFDIDIYGIRTLQSEVNHDVIKSIRNTFQIISDVWPSSVPVATRVTFTDLGSPDALASGGGVLFVLFDHSPDKELLPVAAAEAITGRDLNSNQKGLDRYDVLIKVNLRTSWHLNTRSSPAKHEYDLVTVLLHEAYHNLLFSGAIAVNLGEDRKSRIASLMDGYSSRFDLFLANENGCAVLDYLKDNKLASRVNMSMAELLAQSVMNDRLFFNDLATGVWIPLSSPKNYSSKSSIYHVDTSRGAQRSFMNRFISGGFVHRGINEEIRKIQMALLNPLNRGARHCSFPLSSPLEKGPMNTSSPPFEHFSTVQPSQTQGVSRWILILLCILAAGGIVVLCLCCSSTIFKNMRSNRNGAIGGKRFDRSMSDLSTSSNTLSVDDGMSVGGVNIDTRGIEIDMDDIFMSEYRLEERMTDNSAVV